MLSTRGRRRLRWIVYSFLGLVAVFLVAGVVVLRSGRVERALHGRLVEALTRALGHPVTVDRVAVQYVPPGVVVEGIRSDGPLVSVSRVEATLGIRGLLRGRLSIRDVIVSEPVIRWDIDSQRLLARLAQKAEGGAIARRLDLGRLNLEGGAMVIGSERRAFSAEMEGLVATAGNTGGRRGARGYKGPWGGSASFRKGRISFHDFAVEGLEGGVTFEADPETVRLGRLSLRAEGLEIHGDGRVLPGRPPRVDSALSGTVDPASPGLTRPLPQFGAAGASIEARLSYEGEGTTTVEGSFDLDAPSVDLDRGEDADGPARPWVGRSAHGTFLAAGGGLSVSASVEGMAGGSLTGEYVSTPDPAGGPGHHRVEITARGLDLGDLLSRLHLPGDPAVAPSSSVSGRASMRWEAGGFEAVDGTARLRLTADPGDTPLSGTTDLSWKGRRMRLDASSLDIPGASIGLTGEIDLTGETPALDLEAAIASTVITPLARFVEKRFASSFEAPAGADRPRLLPTDLTGALDATVEVSGTAASPRARVAFRTGEITLSLPPMVEGDVTRYPLTLDVAEGRLDYSTRLVDLQIERAAGEGFDASFGLGIDPVTGRVLALRADAPRLPAALLGRLAGLDVERLGLDGSARVTAGLAAPAGGGPGLAGPLTLASDAMSLGGLTVSETRATGRLEGDTLILEEAALRLLGAEMTGSGRIPLSTAEGVAPGTVDVKVRGLDLGEVERQFSGPSLSGTIDLAGTVTIDGTTRVTGTLDGTAIEIAGIPLGTATGGIEGPLERPRLTIADTEGTLSAAATLTFAAPEADEPAAGGPLPWIDLAITARGFGLDKVRPLLPRGALPGLEGDADGSVTVHGPLMEPGDLQVRAEMDRVNLTAGGRPVRNDGPVRITVQDGFLTLAPTRLVGENGELTLAGSMALDGTYDVTARLQGTYDLGIIKIILPGMRASGPGTVDLMVVQHADTLTYQGTITLDGGRVTDPALPLPLEDVHGRAAFGEDGTLAIESLTFTTGGGTVTGRGWTRFEGAAMPAMHLELKGQGIRAEILPEFRAFFDADVTVDKLGEELRVGGKINVLRGIYSRSFGLEPADMMLKGREFGPGAGQAESSVPIVLDLKIEADGGVWVRNKDARIETSADLALGGTLSEPELSGRISAIEGGLFRFRDVTYTIVGGSLDFTEVTRIDPLLSIEAATRVQQYEVTLHVSGRFSKPVFDVTSEPPLSQREIVMLLLTGRVPTEAGNEASRTLAEGQVATYLAAPVTGAVSAPLEKVLGVSSLQIDPFFLNGTADPSARLTVTKQVTPDLLFTYSSSLGQSGQEIYQFEYNPGRIWDVLATRNYDGALGADFRFRRRWRGAGVNGEDDAGDESRIRFGRITLVADRLPGKGNAVLGRLPFDEGDVYRRGDMLEGREAVREYYARHGYPLAQVNVAEDEPAGEDPALVNVTYAVRSGPLYEIAVAGDVSHRTIRKAVRRAWTEPVMLDDLVGEANDAARSALADKGYYATQVEATETAGGPETRVVRLDIDPGSKVHVREILIEGNGSIAEDRIRRQILTREDLVLNPLRRGLLRQKVLEDDADAIRGLYLANGYLSAEVPAPRVSLSPDGQEADVTFTIREGPRWLVGTVGIEGEAEGVPSEFLLENGGLEPSAVVTTEAMSAASDRVRATLDKHGYWKSRVSTRLEGEPEQSRVVLTIVPGERARVRNVVIEGNTRTQTRLVSREITIKEGEYLSRASLLRTQRNLYGLGVFRSVEVIPEPVDGEPDLMDVKIHLREGSPLLTAWGVGYDTESRARASFEVGHNNLFGTRRSAGLFVRESTVDRRFQVTLRDPNLFGERIESLWSAFFEKQEFDSYDERRRGGSMQLSRKFGEKTTAFGRYLLEDIDIFNLQVSISEARVQTARLGSFGLSLAHDTRDDIINPARGGFSTADVRLYHHGLGSQEEFYRLFGSMARYRDIGRKVVWASSLRAGLLTSRGIPISERFFAGGDTTLRGFAYNTVGPEDPDTGKPVGGQGLFLLNTELRFPIYGALRGVAFYDTGNVFAGPADYLDDLRQVGGLGLRFDTPVGPFRLEYGWKLDRKPGESPGQFFFSIGQAF